MARRQKKQDPFNNLTFGLGIEVGCGPTRTALEEAVKLNNVSKIKEVLAYGNDVNYKNKVGQNVLHFLARCNQDDSYYDVAEVLLKNGADVNARDNKGQTPFYFLVQRANLRMVQLFLSYDADISVINNIGENLLFPAAKNAEVLQLLIDLGLDVNHCSNEGKTPPLHF